MYGSKKNTKVKEWLLQNLQSWRKCNKDKNHRMCPGVEFAPVGKSGLWK